MRLAAFKVLHHSLNWETSFFGDKQLCLEKLSLILEVFQYLWKLDSDSSCRKIHGSRNLHQWILQWLQESKRVLRIFLNQKSMLIHGLKMCSENFVSAPSLSKKNYTVYIFNGLFLLSNWVNNMKNLQNQFIKKFSLLK